VGHHTNARSHFPAVSVSTNDVAKLDSGASRAGLYGFISVLMWRLVSYPDDVYSNRPFALFALI